MGYDNERVYGECEDRDSRPIIPLRETPAVKAGKAGPPICEHGEWRFAGADPQRRGAKWRCPAGGCSPASRWVKASRLRPLVPRESKRWKSLYISRAAVDALQEAPRDARLRAAFGYYETSKYGAH